MIVILALPRSYSSVACAMLGQHPQLYDLLETQIFEVDTMRAWWRRYGIDNHDGDGLTRVIAEVVYGDQRMRTVRHARRWLRMHLEWSMGDILTFLMERLNPLIPVEKNPIEGDTDERIQEALQRRYQLLPNAWFLHLTRHPLSYGLSHLEHLRKMAEVGDPLRMQLRYKRMVDESSGTSVVDPQVLWYRVTANIVRFLDTTKGIRFVRMRSEDLLSDPRRQLKRIAQRFGLRTDERAIDDMMHPERSPFAGLGPPNARFGGDPTFFRSPMFRSGAPGIDRLEVPLPWRRDGSSFKPHVCELAHSLGYT